MLLNIMTIVGPLILLAVLVWAIANNRRSRQDEARTEAATHDRYMEQDAADKSRNAPAP